MRKEEFYYDSRDQKTKIHGIRWIPDTEVCAVLQLVHGMAEYIERYDEVATWFAERGVLVTGNDHLGHGKTLGEDGVPGYFCRQDPATVVVRDVHRLKKMTQEMYPGVPYFILGHSMGSFVLRNYLFRYGSGIDGAIICGTGSQPKATIKAALLLANIQGLFLGDKHIGTFLNKLAFGDKSKLEPDHVNDWLCTDHSVVEKYDADPLCGFTFTINGFKTLFGLIDRQNNKKNVEKMPRELPVKIISGQEDEVGNCGPGVTQVYDEYLAMGMKDVECTLYEGLRHEILNEPCKETVYKDIYDWIMEKKIKEQ